MESLQNNFSAPAPSTVSDVSCKSINDRTIDPFMTLSFMAEEYMMEELNTVNESVLEDYSQMNQSAMALPEGTGLSHQIISETPCIDNLIASQQETESETTPLHGGSSLSFQATEAPEVIEYDEDVLPPSPVPLNNSRRTPVSISRSSAFVTMATGSPVLGSLRTLRNIDDNATLEVPNRASSGTDSYHAHLELENSHSKTKSMRHIHFESDSGSNHSMGESPSSFLSDPSREIDRSLLRPTASRISTSILEEESGIEFIEEVKRADREHSISPQDSVAIPPAQRTCEPDSASDKLTPSSTISPPFTPTSENPLTAASYPDPDSQTREIVDCFQTQDLVSKKLPDLSPKDDQLDSSVMIVTPQLALTIDQPLQRSSLRNSTKSGSPAYAEAMQEAEQSLLTEENDHREQTTVETLPSQADTPESPQSNDWVPFEAVTRIYDPKDRCWHIRIFNKMLPYEKFEDAMTGSVLDQFKMGLFDNVLSDSMQGSRFETFPELMLRQNQSILGYSADVSGSIKSDCASLRTSRLSIASTFETAPIACSSLLSRTSLDSQFAVNEFVVPKYPIRSRNARNAGVDAKDAEGNAKCSEQNADPTPDNESARSIAASSVMTKNQEAPGFTNVKTIRKRSRKPKVLESIKENDAGAVTPPKRGRPRKVPVVLSDTPDKSQQTTSDIRSTTQSSGIGESVEASSSNSGNSSNPSSESKSSEDYLQEIEEALKDMRNKSYEIGKLVYAQWTDKCYYAAQIVKRDAVQTGKWTVRFDDGQTRSLIEEFILPVSILGKRQSILVLNEDLSEGRPGVIIGHHKNLSTGQIDHLVEMDGSDTIRVPRKRICLTQEHIREWNDSVVVPQLFSPHTCNVSLDNILGGKRRRATTVDLSSTTPQKSPRPPRTPRSKAENQSGEQTPKGSRTPHSTGSLRKKTRSKRDLHFDTSTMSESSGTSMLQQEECSLKERITQRLQPSSLAPSTSSEAIESECSEDAESTEEPNIHLTGPIPENSGIFAGFTFILTRATRPLEIDPEDITDELEPYLDMAPYYKEHIRRQLEAGGGRVLERFDRSQLQVDEDTVLVVCNRPCRTERYIRSLAANIRAVSHLWVYECCRKMERLNYQRYYLPPGIDLSGNIVEWSPNTGRCFVGVRMLVQGPPEFCDLWVPVLVHAECVIVSRLPTRTHKGESDNPSSNDGCEKTLCDDVPFDFVLATKDCPAKITDQANRMKIPLVSSIWVIQSLIHGKILDPSSRPEFAFNHE